MMFRIYKMIHLSSINKIVASLVTQMSRCVTFPWRLSSGGILCRVHIGQKCRELTLLKFLSKFKTSLWGPLFRPKHITVTSACLHQRRTSWIIISRSWVSSCVKWLAVWAWRCIALFWLWLWCMMWAVPLIGSTVRSCGWCVHHLWHGTLTKVQKHSCSIGACHGLSNHNRSHISCLELSIINSLHSFICGIEDSESVLIRHPSVWGIRHRMILLIQMMLGWIYGGPNLWPCALICGSLHQLIRILIAVP